MRLIVHVQSVCTQKYSVTFLSTNVLGVNNSTMTWGFLLFPSYLVRGKRWRQTNLQPSPRAFLLVIFPLVCAVQPGEENSVETPSSSLSVLKGSL